MAHVRSTECYLLNIVFPPLLYIHWLKKYCISWMPCSYWYLWCAW